MGDFNIWGPSSKKKSSNFNLGLKAPKAKSFNLGLGTQKKEIKRDSRRTFIITQQKELKDRQNNRCNLCGTELSDDNVDYDHIIPWEDGGKTTLANGQAICLKCHRKKTRKDKLKKVDKKRVKKENTNSFGGLSFGLPPKRSKSPFGF